MGEGVAALIAARARAGPLQELLNRHAELHQGMIRLTQRAMESLMQYPWPGNVRELENIMERLAAFLGSFSSVASIDYQQFLMEAPELANPAMAVTPAAAAVETPGPAVPVPPQPARLDASAIVGALSRAGGNRQLAAAMLGVSRTTLWRRLREEQPEGQRLEGEQIKCDIAVPPGAIAQFIAEGNSISEAILSGVRINPFGHLGDGNIHYNLSPPAGATGFGGKAAEIASALAALASKMGGSFAAEHGLGRSKIALADALRGPVERTLMARVKNALDPRGNMNPDVLIRSSEK